MLLLALGTLAIAPLLDAAARRAVTGGKSAGGLIALNAWMAVVACGVVLLEVLPEGIERLGVFSIVIAFVGAVLTSAAHHGGGDRWVSVAALVGLGAHSFLDGIAITGGDAAMASGVGVATAIHNAPAGVAIWRAAGREAPRVLGLAIAATLAGGVVGELHLVSATTALSPVLTAVQCFVAGSVLHIATHAASPRTVASPAAGPSAPVSPVPSALGALAGTATVALICAAQPAETPFGAELPAFPTALALWLEAAPWIFAALLLVFLLSPRVPVGSANAIVGVFATGAWLGPAVAGAQLVCLAPVLLRSRPSASPDAGCDPADPGCCGVAEPRPRQDVVAETAPWLLAGLAVASLVEPWMAQDLGRIPIGVQLVTAVVLPMFISSPLALAPVAAVLIHKGANPAVALALTLPALLAPLLAPLLGRLRVPTTARPLGSALIALAVAAVSTASFLPLGIPDLHVSAAHQHSVIEYACGAAIAGLTLAALLRSGLHGFARTLGAG